MMYNRWRGDFFPPLLVALNRNPFFPDDHSDGESSRSKQTLVLRREEVAPQQADLSPDSPYRSLCSGEDAVLSPTIWGHHSAGQHESFDARRRLWRRPPPASQ